MAEQYDSDESEIEAGIEVPVFAPLEITRVVYDCRFVTTEMDVFATTMTLRPIRKNGSRKDAMKRNVLLPAIKIPPKVLNKKLIKERNKFMKNLKRERSDKLKLENWAANKIQKLYRSYATGPKIYTVYTRKARQMSLQIIRQDLEQLQLQMDRRESPEEDAVCEGELPQWRKSVKSRAQGKRKRKDAMELANAAAIRIQTIIRMHFAKRGYDVKVHQQQDIKLERQIVHIQCCMRGYLARLSASTRKDERRLEAALLIQAFVRGYFGREKVKAARRRIRCQRVEEKSAVCIQARYRGFTTRRAAVK